GLEIQYGIRDAGDGAAYNVGDRDDRCTALASQTRGRQRVGCLARLRDGDTKGIRPDDGVGIAVLRGNAGLDGDARPTLNSVLAEKAGVVRGAAGYEGDAADLVERSGRHQPIKLRQPQCGHAIMLDDTAKERTANRMWLLVDLL